LPVGEVRIGPEADIPISRWDVATPRINRCGAIPQTEIAQGWIIAELLEPRNIVLQAAQRSYALGLK